MGAAAEIRADFTAFERGIADFLARIRRVRLDEVLGARRAEVARGIDGVTQSRRRLSIDAVAGVGPEMQSGNTGLAIGVALPLHAVAAVGVADRSDASAVARAVNAGASGVVLAEHTAAASLVESKDAGVE